MDTIREKLDQAQRELTVADELESAANSLRYRAAEHRKAAIARLAAAGEQAAPRPETDTIHVGPAS